VLVRKVKSNLDGSAMIIQYLPSCLTRELRVPDAVDAVDAVDEGMLRFVGYSKCLNCSESTTTEMLVL